MSGKLLAQHLAGNRGAREVLTQAVMQVAADAPLLSLADTEQLALQPLAFRDLLGQSRRSLPDAILELALEGVNPGHRYNNNHVGCELNRSVPADKKRSGKFIVSVGYISRNPNCNTCRRNDQAEPNSDEPCRNAHGDQIKGRQRHLVAGDVVENPDEDRQKERSSGDRAS